VKALIIEDDPEIVDSVFLALHIHWPEAQLVATHLGRKGIEMAETEDPDIIILDLGLPDISGFEVLKHARLFSSVPIVILTVKSEEASIAKGLEWGADDYIVKPCGHLELLARVKARLRDRHSHLEDSPLSFGPLRFDPTTRQLTNGRGDVKLTAIEGHIIHHLMRNAGRVSTYSSLAEYVWGDDYPGSMDSLRVHIRRLREKLELNPSHPTLIQTKAGVGYSLAKPEQTSPAAAPAAPHNASHPASGAGRIDSDGQSLC
jgi:DNA-binding response OmpR family regulator